MKNVTVVPRGGGLRIPIPGREPLKGWAVRYVSGIEGEPDIKPGDWLSEWSVGGNPPAVTFWFESGLHMCFNDEERAKRVAQQLRETAEIETEVVKL